MVYKEIDPMIWKYENDGDNIEGILVGIESEIGVNKSTIYSIETAPGQFTGVWGSTILDQRMSLVKVGSKIRITYKGLSEKKPGKNPAKIFKVEVDVEEETELPPTK